MFHAGDNLYFERLDSGNVRILKRKNTSGEDAEDVLAQTIDVSVWESIVTHVSCYGSTDSTYRTIKLIHEGGYEESRLDPGQ